MILKYTIKETDNFDNIKQLLKNYFHISERLFIRLKNNNLILVNDKTIKNYKIDFVAGDNIIINLNYNENNSNIISTKMDLSIIYEDDAYIIINKPAGITTHPSLLHYNNSLSNGIKYYFDEINLKKKIRPVNRLDKNTSGLILFAKNEYIQEQLIRQMSENKFEKEYIGIVEGNIRPERGKIDFPIKREQNSIIKRCVSEDGERAITHYKVLNVKDDFSVVKFKLETGRTHQIRVHSSYIGHPILGDTLYGNESKLIDRQALHAYKIRFIHPISNKNVKYIAPIPNDMQNIIDKSS